MNIASLKTVGKVRYFWGMLAQWFFQRANLPPCGALVSVLVARRHLAFTGLEETECTRSIIYDVLVSERSTADRQTISEDVLGWLSLLLKRPSHAPISLGSPHWRAYVIGISQNSDEFRNHSSTIVSIERCLVRMSEGNRSIGWVCRAVEMLGGHMASGSKQKAAEMTEDMRDIAALDPA